jgi:hypothetical protein
MKVYGEMDVWIHVSLSSVVVGGEWSASRSCRFTSGERAHSYPLDRRLGEPQSRSERYGEVKILDHIGTRTSVIQPVGSRYTNCDTAAYKHIFS